MSSARSAPLFILDLRRSRYLVFALSALHLLALLSLVVCKLPGWLAIALAITVSLSYGLSLVQYANPTSRWFVEQIRWTADGKWQLRTAQGAEQTADLAGSYVHPKLLILRFKRGRFNRQSVLVLPDSADPDEIRQLRVWLQTAKRE